MKTSKERKLQLLESPKWNYHDIKDWCECGTTKAYQILNDAKSNGGSIKYFTNFVTRDSVLKILSVDIKREMEILNEK